MDGLAVILAMRLVGQATAPTTEGSEFLPVTPGAVDVARNSTGRSASIYFSVRESYPAIQSVVYIRNAMPQHGWKAVEVLGFGAVDVGDSPRWFDSIKARRNRGPRGYAWSLPGEFSKGHRWQAWWQNESGRGAVVTIEYACPMEEQGLHSTWARVSARTFGADEAEEEERARKQARDELCVTTRERQPPGCQALPSPR
jgi:hypothetical protein